MKKYLKLMIMLFVTSNAFAAGFDCNLIENQSIKRKVILNQIEAGDLKANSSKKFELLFVDVSKMDDTLHLIDKVSGVLSLGDVDIDFVSDDGKVKFSTYLDETNSGRLEIRGLKVLKFNCTEK